MKNSIHYQRFITGAVLATGFWIIFFYGKPFVFSLLLLSILLVILIKEWPVLFRHRPYLYWMLMPFYPILPFILLIILNHSETYRILLYYLFLTVFSFDTGSYIVGSILGRYKMAPFISPHKTIEGTIGGFLIALMMFQLGLWEQHIYLLDSTKYKIVFIICFLAFWGDLFESMLKRRALVKDSGQFLPGHGGFLDRFDAVMFVAIFFYAFRHQLILLFH
ncbi:phosphatidate cytidylyltransferase [Candidatus Dependentiae bacterium]|nr:phosphatidate cytidylyltransferase [Candidatus Dependentiae bacterium]